jgi:hypothetical protein
MASIKKWAAADGEPQKPRAAAKGPSARQLKADMEAALGAGRSEIAKFERAAMLLEEEAGKIRWGNPTKAKELYAKALTEWQHAKTAAVALSARFPDNIPAKNAASAMDYKLKEVADKARNALSGNA